MVSHRLGREVWDLFLIFGQKNRQGCSHRFRRRNGMKIGDPTYLTVLTNPTEAIFDILTQNRNIFDKKSWFSPKIDKKSLLDFLL